MTENKWRENLKETTRLITSQAFSLKITNLILELQYGLMVIHFDRAHVHTRSRIEIIRNFGVMDYKIWIKIRIIELSISLYIVVLHNFTSEIKRLSRTHDDIFSFWSKLELAEDIDRHLCRHILF